MKTITPSPAEIEERVARFEQLQPMSTMKDNDRVPQGAKDLILARKIMPVILERTESPFGNLAPVYEAAGMTMFISVCPPGQGPGLHAHVKTFETFTVLEGTFEFSVGDRGEQTIVLNKWDSFSCPPGWCRGFKNVDTRDSVLQTVITGGVHDRNDIGLPPIMAERLEAYGTGVLDEFKKIGLSFDAGVENEPAAAGGGAG
jgi:quercetin dioxygenase-like cupin family protein